jgi:hypothetical protein
VRRLFPFTLALAALLAITPGSALADPNNESATFELHIEVPNIAEAPNGDQVAVTGGGVFGVHPKSVTASGAFTHTDSAGNVLATGTWTATSLRSFEFYGCGVLTFTDPDTELPSDFCGGALKLAVSLTPDGTTLALPGTLTIFCIIGPQTPATHEDPSGEGVTLVVNGVLNFNKIVSGMNVYIKTS